MQLFAEHQVDSFKYDDFSPTVVEKNSGLEIQKNSGVSIQFYNRILAAETELYSIQTVKLSL